MNTLVKDVFLSPPITEGYVSSIAPTYSDPSLSIIEVNGYMGVVRTGYCWLGSKVLYVNTNYFISLTTEFNLYSPFPLTRINNYNGFLVKPFILDNVAINIMIIDVFSEFNSYNNVEVLCCDFVEDKISLLYGDLFSADDFNSKIKIERLNNISKIDETDFNSRVFQKFLYYESPLFGLSFEKNNYFVLINGYKFRLREDSFVYKVLKEQNFLKLLSSSHGLIFLGSILGPSSLSDPFCLGSDEFYLLSVYEINSNSFLPIYEVDVIINSYKKNGIEIRQFPSIGFHAFTKGFSFDKFIGDNLLLKENFPLASICYARLDGTKYLII